MTTHRSVVTTHRIDNAIPAGDDALPVVPDQPPPCEPLPDVEVVDVDGFVVRLSNLDRASSAADVTEALELDGLVVDGVPCTADSPIIDVIRVGSRIGGPVAPPRSRPTVDLEFALVAGADCRAWQPLTEGRHIIGRGPGADLRIHDPSVELHHAIVEVRGHRSGRVSASSSATSSRSAPPSVASSESLDDVTVELLQLTGAVPIRVVGTDRHPEPGEPLALPVILAIGAVRLAIRRRSTDARSSDDSCGSVVRHPSDPWRSLVRRSRDDEEPPPEASVTAPESPQVPPRPPATPLIGATTAAVGSVVVAVVVRTPMFLVFGGIGALTAVATWLAGVFSHRRRCRNARDIADREVRRFERNLREVAARRRRWHEQHHRGVVATSAIAIGHGPQVWMRRARPDDPDGESTLRASIGTGTAVWSIDIAGADRCGSPGGEGHRERTAINSAERIAEVEAPITLRAGDVVAIRGAGVIAAALARGLLVQFATSYGPADWRLLVMSDHHADWEWASWLPHVVDVTAASDADGFEGRLSSSTGDSGDRAKSDSVIVVVTDRPDSLTERSSPLRRLLRTGRVAVIVVADPSEPIPACCTRVLRIGSTGRAMWSGDVPVHDLADDVAVAGVTIATATSVARRLAPLVDPECVTDEADLPTRVGFGELVPASSAQLTARWARGGVDPPLRTPVGVSTAGTVDVDLVRDGPHALVAGTTGSGKSELLRTLVLGLAMASPPTHLHLVLIDFKGGAAFDSCARLPHTVGVVTDLDGGLVERVVTSLRSELHRRERILRAAGVADLSEYRRRGKGPSLARLVIVVDEFAALAVDHPDSLRALVGIAQRGRSLGLHLVLATQRPAGVIGDDIRANTDLRMSLRVNDRADALDVVGDPSPADFPGRAPGRLAIRTADLGLVVVQSAQCTGPVEAPSLDGGATGRPGRRRMSVTRLAARVPTLPRGRDTPGTGPDLDELDAAPTQLDALVEAIVVANDRAGAVPARRPWIEPLPHPLLDIGACLGAAATAPLRGDGVPTRLDLVGSSLVSDGDGSTVSGVADGPGVVGVVDDPVGQCRRVLAWQPGDGHLSVIGAVDSGATSTLITLAAATCRGRRGDELHLYVIDARGDGRLAALDGLAPCGGVVGVGEVERLHRLLVRLEVLVEERVARRSTGSEPCPVVVMVDGWSSVRRRLRSPERTDDGDRLDRLVADGPTVGLVIVAVDDENAMGSSLPSGERWVLALPDPAVARSFGLTARPVERDLPGRLRVVSSGLEAQVVVGAPGLADVAGRDADRSGPPPVDVLPRVVRLPQILRAPAGSLGSIAERRGRRSSGRLDLAVGIGADTLGVECLSVVGSDPVLVVGDAGSGVSTALRAIVEAWSALHDGTGADVVWCDADGAATPNDLVAGRPTIVVVDDAHRIDRPSGIVAEVVAGASPDVLLVVGARADAVRSAYGHWTRELARSRSGVVMSGRDEEQGGDVFGVSIPRRRWIAARAGLAWLVDGGPLRMVQLAS